MNNRYSGSTPPRLKNADTLQVEEIDHDGAKFIKAVIVDAIEHTPADTDIPGGATDGILVTANSTVVVKFRERPSTAVSLYLTAGIWHPISVIRVVSSSTGAVIIGWQRKAKV